MHKPQKEQEIDITKMSANDLDTLRRKDPFLYHSIPQVNKATLSVKTVDHSKVLKDTASATSLSSLSSSDDASSSSSSSCSTSMVVARKTRITTEVAPSMLLEELIYGGLDTSTSSTDDDDDSSEECCSSIAILDELMDSVRDYNFPGHYTEEHLGQ